MKTISVDELKAKLDANESINLLDVREELEHADFNVGGTNFTLRRIQDMAIEDIEHLKNEEVICYCRSGNRSNMACLMLEHLGFTNTVNVVGGMIAWQEKFNG
ncbi:MAG TPA: rhodanese-like domain-containing protein [Chitinophagaceae bacterium]|jgi:rhodanese-related sulfurtransferase|nr:rhodanese-like domain-containing protein [Chitinophagaceae bacterium]HPH22830.1 rhodanese-like domain-containing protein [Chitinophagaceae bacterium]